jgi:ABC-2 type transport system permease protein
MKAMARKIIKHLDIMWQMQKVDIMSRMEYRINFFIQIFTVGLQMLFSVIFIKTVFGFAGNIAGWNYYEALLIVGTYMIVEGLMWVTCAYLSGLARHVRDGTLDGLLVKPIDTQFLVSIWRGDAEDFTRIVSGVAVIIYALKHLDIAAGNLMINLFLYLILLFNAFIITYSINLFLKSINFWVTNAQALSGFGFNITRMTQYPSDIFYHKIIKIITTFIIPLAFMATIPAKILAHGFDGKLISLSIIVAAIFFFLSRKFFYFSLSKYESASS